MSGSWQEAPHPSVTVLMPVYNAERYVTDALESILNQTFGDFEFIVINDGSTDKSLEILKRYAAQDDRIRLISRENRGLVATLNEGLALARTPLIARMDADDISLPERLQLQAAFMDAHREVVCVGSYCDIIDATGRVIGIYSSMPTGHKEILDSLLNGVCVITHPTAMFRRERVLHAGGYDAAWMLVEDHELWLRLCASGELAGIPIPLLRYREHDVSVSSMHHHKQLEVKRRMLRHAREARGMDPECKVASWRPTTSNERYERLKAIWYQALERGKWSTALVYACKGIARQPWRPGGWWRVVKTPMVWARHALIERQKEGSWHA
jgi:glycosyltransferase involved in cell wall biosynthesis